MKIEIFDQPMNWVVYKMSENSDSPAFYIGVTTNMAARFSSHFSGQDSAAREYIRHLAATGKEYGMYSIAKFPDRTAALDFEAYLIGKTSNLLNKLGAVLPRLEGEFSVSAAPDLKKSAEALVEDHRAKTRERVRKFRAKKKAKK